MKDMDSNSTTGNKRNNFGKRRKKNNNGKFGNNNAVDHKSKKQNNKKDHKKNNGITTHHVYGRNNRLEIKFDPTARHEYLVGASQRKKERRIYGLAMQKLKDRRAKVENRREEMEARKEQIEEAERQKEQSLYGHNVDLDGSNNGSDSDNNSNFTNRDETKEPDKKSTSTNTEKNGKMSTSKTTETFQDEQTKSQFGGDVIVTTTFGIPEEEDEDEDWKRLNKQKNKKNIDTEQRYNNCVQKYIAQVKGNLPNKRKRTQQNPFFANKKGNHGASGMKGMGSAKDLKMAQKTLKNARTKGGKGQQQHDSGGRGGGKRRRR